MTSRPSVLAGTSDSKTQTYTTKSLSDGPYRDELSTISMANLVTNFFQLSGQVAMTLHAFCDEGSTSASFPFSVLFMTIKNKESGITFHRCNALQYTVGI